MTVDKTVRVQLEPEEVEVLQWVAELARMYFDKMIDIRPAAEGRGGNDHTISHFDVVQTQRIREFMMEIFAL